MTGGSFSKSEVLRLSWAATKSHIGILVASLILVFLVPLVPLIFSAFFVKYVLILSLLFVIAGWLLQMLMILGLVRIFLGICDEEEVHISDLFRCYPYLVRFIIALILYVVIVMVGLILLVLPGIYFAVKFAFHPFIIVDEDAGAIESLKKSWAITEGSVGNLILIGIVLMGINFLGMLLLFVGMIITVPFSYIAAAQVYRRLGGQTVIERPVNPAVPLAPFDPKDRIHERLDRLHEEN